MSKSDTGNWGTGDSRVTAVTAALAQPAQLSQPGRQLRVLAALAGITGPLLLAAYFTTPALVRWPSAGASPGELGAYATAHRLLFTAADGCRPPGRC